MSAYGDNPTYHAIRGGEFVCTAPGDAPCRTSPTCECENWCGCDGSPEDANDNHDGDERDHCCMTTREPGRECWLAPWIDAVGIEDSFGDPLNWPDARVWQETGYPDGAVTCEWDDGVYWKYAEPAVA